LVLVVGADAERREPEVIFRCFPARCFSITTELRELHSVDSGCRYGQRPAAPGSSGDGHFGADGATARGRVTGKQSGGISPKLTAAFPSQASAVGSLLGHERTLRGPAVRTIALRE
jgi:hypothetical protein